MEGGEGDNFLPFLFQGEGDNKVGRHSSFDLVQRTYQRMTQVDLSPSIIIAEIALTKIMRMGRWESAPGRKSVCPIKDAAEFLNDTLH